MALADNVTMSIKFPQEFFKDYARGKECQIRVARSAGYGCGHVDTTVLCHPSIAGLKAMGSRKASVPDIGGAWGCDVCHALCDGRIRPKQHSPLADMAKETDGPFVKLLIQNALLEGSIRTIDKLVKAGVLPNP